MTQPILTYTVDWGTGNVYQKLSGKSYVNPNGQTVDCSSITVTFSSSVHFKKFYATAVKNGNAYGFEDDILVDIRETNPTGVLLYELTERNANTNFSFTITHSQLTAGDGLYRVGLYVQADDGTWNYEYFLVDNSGNQLVTSNGDYLQVPVVTSVSLISFTINGITYQAIEGMTWGEWINSNFNTSGFKTVGSGGGDRTVATSDGRQVLDKSIPLPYILYSTAIIESSHTYVINSGTPIL